MSIVKMSAPQQNISSGANQRGTTPSGRGTTPSGPRPPQQQLQQVPPQQQQLQQQAPPQQMQQAPPQQLQQAPPQQQMQQASMRGPTPQHQPRPQQHIQAVAPQQAAQQAQQRPPVQSRPPPPAASSGAASAGVQQQAPQQRPQSAMPVRSHDGQDRVTPNKPVDLPLEGTMIYAMQLALKKDKPIILTFWIDSLQKQICYMYDDAEKETIIFKSPEEYTSPIVQKYNNKTDVICETENSLYIIRAGMDTRNA